MTDHDAFMFQQLTVLASGLAANPLVFGTHEEGYTNLTPEELIEEAINLQQQILAKMEYANEPEETEDIEE